MSCSTQTSQAIRLTVTVGNLPEGYCPANFQQFATDFAARLIVTPNQNNSTFVTGSVEPTSNVGPWLKNCEEWFVYNDSTGRYRPETVGVFKNFSYYTSNSAFVVPDNIYKIKVHAWGGGGGGGDMVSSISGGGGGAGGFGLKIFDVTPGQVVPVTVGAGGTNGTPGNSGGNTTVLTLIVNGGAGGGVYAGAGSQFSNGGLGGTVAGADFSVSGGTGSASYGTSTTTMAAGEGGSSPQGGSGGVNRNGGGTALNGVTPGGGGVGGNSTTPGNTSAAFPATGGSGATGAVLVEY